MAPWLVRLASRFTPAFSQSESDLSPDSALPLLMGRGPHKQLRARPLVSIQFLFGIINAMEGGPLPAGIGFPCGCGLVAAGVLALMGRGP